MIREKQNGPIVIDLTGPDGNAYALLGYASRLARMLGLDGKAIQAEMTSGDYENLVETMEKYFGDHIIMER